MVNIIYYRFCWNGKERHNLRFRWCDLWRSKRKYWIIREMHGTYFRMIKIRIYLTYSEVNAIFHLKRSFSCRNQQEHFLKANAFPTLMISKRSIQSGTEICILMLGEVQFFALHWAYLFVFLQVGMIKYMVYGWIMIIMEVMVNSDLNAHSNVF